MVKIHIVAKVTAIESETPGFMTNVVLDDIKFVVPIWTRIYKLIAPEQFDMELLNNLKEAVLKYDVQYAILKYGTYENTDFDAIHI